MAKAPETTADDEYVEAILVWSDQGPAAEVESWLHDHGFQTQEMAAGLLVSGTGRQFKAAFGVDPLVDLLARHDQRVAGSEWVDRQEPDGAVVGPDETPGQLTVDDLREEGAHQMRP